MFSKVVTNSSRFLMMPQSSQNLYFHLGMNADDDGFCEHFTIMRMTESKPDDLKVLHAKGFVQVFDDKVLIITDWKENNYLRSDRYTPSKYLEIYKEELKALSSGIPKVDQMDTQDRLGKDRLGKENIPAKSRNTSEVNQIIEKYFSLKGWVYENTPSQQKLWKRHLRSAKDLLELCEGDIEEAKKCLDIVYEYASSRGLEWTIETVFKRWYDLDHLKPKEKKPYFQGKRIFQKVKDGKWWCVSKDGEIRELGIWPKKDEIIYK